MNLNELRDLDLNNVASWPLPVKAVFILLLCGVVLFLGYWFHLSNQLQVLESAERQESRLKGQFEHKADQAANLDAYREQLEEIRESFGALLRQLPSEAEVADLLVDISQTGLAAGLEFDLFKPEAEQRRDFYATMPIRVRVVGNYHQFGQFVGEVSAMPRIVTLHEITITEAGRDEEAPLVMEAEARTYRYLEDEEIDVEH